MKSLAKLLPFMFLSLSLGGQSAVELQFRIEEALEQDFYDQGMELIKEGESLYPEDSRFPLMLGRLLNEKGLYSGALAALERAEKIDPENGEVLNELVLVHGYRDENEAGLPYLERLTELPDYREDALEDLAWNYYKLHRLKEGEKLLLEELEKGFNRSMAHTLGTVYAGLYQYELSQKYYQQSIDDALSKGDSYFASIAYYNLSILEYQYYRFEESFRLTGLSLEQKDRASGHIARGELLQLRGDFQGARNEFLQADQLADHPLARVDLARLHWEWGRLEEAREYADSVRDWEDPSWMYYFGIDRDEMDRDLAELYRDIYRGLARRERILPRQGFRGLATGSFNRIRYSLLYRFHDSAFRRLCHRLGREQIDRGNLIRGRWVLYRGSQGYGRTSLYFLEQSRELELASIPAAKPWYLLFQGKEEKSEALLIQAREKLDPQWEASPRSQALEERIAVQGGGRNRSEDLRMQLFKENPGILLRRGWTIPLSLEIQGLGKEKERKTQRRMERYLRRAGFDLNKADSLRLSLIFSDRDCSWLLLDRENRSLRSGRISLPQKAEETVSELKRRELAELLMDLLPELYRQEDQDG